MTNLVKAIDLICPPIMQIQSHRARRRAYFEPAPSQRQRLRNTMPPTASDFFTNVQVNNF